MNDLGEQISHLANLKTKYEIYDPNFTTATSKSFHDRANKSLVLRGVLN